MALRSRLVALLITLPLISGCLGGRDDPSTFSASLRVAGTADVPVGARDVDFTDIAVTNGPVVQALSTVWDAISPNPARPQIDVLWTEAAPSACGLHVTAARLDESSDRVVIQLLTTKIAPADRTAVCAGGGYSRVATIELAQPLGTRTIMGPELDDAGLPRSF